MTPAPLPLPDGSPDTSAAIDALLAVLRPLARLAIDHGVQFGQLEELMKRAMIDAAIRSAEQPGRERAVPASRISVMTGIHRKDVRRLTEAPGLDAVRADSTLAAMLFTRWMTGAAWQHDGRPRVLPRRPPADGGPSFESLARGTTTDVHPRTLLDELARLGLVEHDEAVDTVSLRGEAFVPAGRIGELLGFLGDNVGDHLAAARANVAATLRAAHEGETPRAPFVEQALFADELSQASAEHAAGRAREFWQTLLRSLAPELQRLEDADRTAGRPTDHRIRIGLYSYVAPMPPAEPAAPETRTR